MIDWQELEKKYYMQVVARTPVTLVRGEGARVWDDKGKEYLDFVAGWAVDSLGHCHPVVAEALAKQARTLIQTSNQFFSVPQLQLAELLVENSCCDRVFIGNSGLEANEGAVKLARRYGHLKLNGAYEVITAFNSFHGRSLAMTAATGQEKFHKPYEPLPAGFINVKYNDIEAIKTATTARTCAVMLEPVQGEGGVNIPSDDYLKKVREWCDSRGILLILDEIQTGVCRLGPLFGYQLYGVEPDIMTLAKGMASGVPIGALLAKEKAAVFALGDHGSTFGGNPLTCAAACAVLKFIIDNNIADNVKKVGKYLLGALEGLKKKHTFIKEVRGVGLLAAVQFDREISQKVLAACLEKGLLVNAVKPDAIRLMPPLVIGRREVDLAVEKLDAAMSGMTL
jgi:acetylornithine/N-succinyldiaminopimelate aminotransferase